MKTFREYLEEKVLTSEERNNLSSKSFGLPKEKKFPLNDAAHVRSAISYFHTCPADKKKTLARKIRSACHKFGIEINKDADWYKYTK